MIALAEDCLVFELTNGERVPFSPEMLSVELAGDATRWLEPDFVQHAVNATFHYFKYELGRQSVSLAEFSNALEKVLAGFSFPESAPVRPAPPPGVMESDLGRLVREAGDGCELLFFPRLRAELRHHLLQGPRLLRFYGLRGCVKQLAGTRRWNPRCRQLEEQIVAYLRECLSAEAGRDSLALVVE